jgi:hypothetical protein
MERFPPTGLLATLLRAVPVDCMVLQILSEFFAVQIGQRL